MVLKGIHHCFKILLSSCELLFRSESPCKICKPRSKLLNFQKITNMHRPGNIFTKFLIN